MKVLYEFIPRLDFLISVEKTKDLVDGWNITDSAGGVPAPSATAVACVLKAKYPDKIVIPMLITNYKGPVEIGAAALAAEANNVDGVVPDPGDAPKYGHLIRTREDGNCQILIDPDEIDKYRHSTGPAEEVRSFLRNAVKIRRLRMGCLLTSRRPAEDSIARIRDEWDFCLFLRFHEESLPRLKQVAAECRHLDKPIYPYFVVGTTKNTKTRERIGWPASATMDGAEELVARLEGVVDGVVATCLGDLVGDAELLEKIQKFRK